MQQKAVKNILYHHLLYMPVQHMMMTDYFELINMSKIPQLFLCASGRFTVLLTDIWQSEIY